MRLLGMMAAIAVLYIAASMIVMGKLPPRATGLLGLTLIAPSAACLVESKPGFMAGFLYVMLIVAATGFFIRLLIGKKLFASLFVSPLRSLAQAWFNRSSGKRMRDVWPGTGRK